MMLLQHRPQLDFHNPCLVCKLMIKSFFGPLSTINSTYFTKIYYLMHDYYFFIVVDYLVNVVFLVDNLV